MFGVWLVLTVFILWALGVSLTRDEKTPRALWEAIIANAVFGALLYLRGLWEQVPCFLAQRRAGNFAMIAAIRRASSFVNILAAERYALLLTGPGRREAVRRHLSKFDLNQSAARGGFL
jgi:hypothetical protein